MPPQNPVQQKPKLRRARPVLRTFIYSILAGLIFLAGLGIGDGRIILSKDQLFRKSVQKNAPARLDYSSVQEVYDALRKDYDGQLDTTKLLDGLKAGLATAAGDPYTEYLNKDAANDFNQQLNGTFTGIGAELSKDDKGNLVVISPIAGFPAEKAGLKPKDIIAEIDGTTTNGMSITDAVNKIRGPKGTTVKLRIIRNSAQDITLNITRDQITVPSVTSKILDGNIGYLAISRYAEDTADLATKAANDFKQKNVKGAILDVRGDPGGLLDAAVSVSSLWLDPGKTILQERRDNVIIRSYVAQGVPVLKGIPTVVLINEGSASASEITAGALHDNGVAKLIGVKSFGKGSVQQLEKLTDGGVLKVTIARWYTPNGVNINKDGIKPDTEVKLSDDDAKAQKDPQLDAATAALK
ncbi:MAG TPA: S41 family peptidase [Candidatus Saccharimonadales bacterium]|nr:S41 family peptidase [Candidatus Saccharimonadales bacterium]